ncbi:carbohydrate kinase [Sphingomonas oligophenolica]|uniref:Carbohydrate kinase n=1 Tax=Sphingomonas oligophenolica TaxID=301154 RepID=A0ABU9YBN8_9SPHN
MHLVCGEALYDLFVDDGDPGSAEVVLKAVAGGSPFNVAVGMARLGAKVGFASDLARDFLGERLAAQLAAEGVADSFLRRSAATTALAIVATDGLGQPGYSFTGLDTAVYCPAEVAIEQAGQEIRGIHMGSIAIVLPNSAGALVDLARCFADRALISLDPNVRLSIVPEPANWYRATEALRPHCHVIKLSDEDIAALYGDADQEAVCRAWLNDRTALVVLTRGAEGARMFTRAAGPIHIPAPATAVIDTVGAGDSFMAALLAGLTREGWVSGPAIASLDAQQLFDLGAFAARAAGVTCSRRGPVLPTALELEALDAVSMADV